MKIIPPLLLLLFPCFASLPVVASGAFDGDDPKPGQSSAKFERIVIDQHMPGGYQVEVAEVNGDGKPDVVAVGNGVCAWYENPSWKKRIVSRSTQTPGVISSATADLDGDGKAEIAIAYDFEMNEPKRGKLLLAVQGPTLEDAWKLTPIRDLGSIHRLRWGDFDGDHRYELVAAPIFGPDAKPPGFNQSPARPVLFKTGLEPKSGAWTAQTLVIDFPVVHSIEAIDVDNDGRTDILSACNDGIVFSHLDAKSSTGGWKSRPLVPGAPGTAPKKGSSEIHLGKLSNGRRFLATIEPWHGTDVAVWLEKKQGSLEFEPRIVLDTTLVDGHALWVADTDHDGDDEIFAGHRGKDHRVSIYDFDGKSWTRTVIDHDIAAQDLRGGDLDGDGTPDILAIGGSTHNVVWYRPISPR